MIPKIIHYCWFGKGKMPTLALRCIDSWKKKLPDYELYLWDEDKFDINSVSYVKEAYEARKFAFVSDYVRLYAIYHFGGIYLDTDVEVIKSFDSLLSLPAFLGFETEKEVATSIMASERFGIWSKELLECYQDRHFIQANGSYDITTNVEFISRIMTINGLKAQNSYQIYKGYIHIFPKDYFCPKSNTGILTITPNTFCIHHFEGSWQSKNQKIKKIIFRQLIGPQLTDILVRIKRKFS